MAIKTNLQYFNYFHSYLGYRAFITFGLSFLVGLLDGIGLALFIPLLDLVSDQETIKEQNFITEFVVEILKLSPSLLNILLLIFIFFCLKGIAKFFEGYIRVVYQQYFMRKIRISNIDHLNHYSFLHFAKADIGRIQNTFSGEVGRVNTAFRFYFRSFQYGVLVFVYVLMAFIIDASFTLMVAVGGIATNFIFKLLYQQTKHFSKTLTSQTHNFQGLLIQKVALFKYLKTTGLNTFYANKLKNAIVGLEDTQRRLGIIDSVLGALREPLVILVVIVTMYLQIMYFDRDLGLIILSLLLLYRALNFFIGMQEQWNMFLGLSGSLENMEAFTRELKKGRETTGSIKFTGLREKMKLINVSFKYDNTVVLDQINIEIQKNKTLALVGESGSGKSTLMSIIAGLFSPSEGEYLIDGQSVNELDLISLKNRIGYIAQDAPIFNDSVFNNVTFWAPKTTENYNKFLKTLEKAAILDFVMQLPEKEETYLGNNGINLSGGQKQRFSIARELFKEVELLLMDEATSALDGETEAIIQKNIDALKGQFTIIVIAHRLATIRNADRIVLLNNGKIEAIGSYAELLKSSTHFQEMIQLQNL